MRLLFACALALFLGACNCGRPPSSTPTPTPEPSTGCASDAECDDSSACTGGVCTPCPACADGARCVKGRCLPVTCGERACPEGTACINDVCADATCLSKTCGQNEKCVHGTCFADACSGTSCGPGQVCADGQCTLDLCVGVICPQGSACAAGRCYSNACEGTVCAVGSVCVAGACVDALCVGVVCAIGQHCVKGVCKAGSECSPAEAPKACGVAGSGCVQACDAMGRLGPCQPPSGPIDVKTDPKNCGMCGAACTALPHAAAACQQGKCVRGPCAPNFFDFDGDPANGCETTCLGLQCIDPTGKVVTLTDPPVPGALGPRALVTSGSLGSAIQTGPRFTNMAVLGDPAPPPQKSAGTKYRNEAGIIPAVSR